jgi:hypothetical protein
MKASELREEMLALRTALQSVESAATLLIQRLNDVAIAQLASEHRINEHDEAISELKRKVG